jgi:hypothetical protein
MALSDSFSQTIGWAGRSTVEPGCPMANEFKLPQQLSYTLKSSLMCA